ncbi:molybdopterin molybdotransferase MoeA [Candidatus Laterigemmans baculatus]|uniref:molybdopterin molybdotransferase MoeA n=1 Tax=Candidatus Laterigemmans baculatus TaxID=2770505 RepID=UPI0013D98A1A|nr:molybdopterin molybdotransferase MoeA [Candidatus Laterigemmans baculatus]
MSALDVIDDLAACLRTAGTMRLPLADAVGRVLRSDLRADRDSPAANVSAMDGYALRASDLRAGAELAVTGESTPGAPPPTTPSPGEAIRIFTGAVVPLGCDAVLRREDVAEQPERIQIAASGELPSGRHIRFQGENSTAGSTILSSGSMLSPGGIAAAANFGAATLEVSRPVRVQTIVTGDELLRVDEPVQPWQLRDSNGPTLAALLRPHPWLELLPAMHVRDELERICEAVERGLQNADALLLTGGVSMGDYDFVPAAVQRAGGRQIFHKLPIRPGKPIFGAVGPEQQLILGLPGNPVSAAVGTVRFGLPLLRRIAHCDPWMPSRPRVELRDDGSLSKTLPLHWFRLVRLTGHGVVERVATQGSGDLVSLALSSGFIEQPPGTSGPGPWPYWSWTD